MFRTKFESRQDCCPYKEVLTGLVTLFYRRVVVGGRSLTTAAITGDQWPNDWGSCPGARESLELQGQVVYLGL
jgi:hypothetical protein